MTDQAVTDIPLDRQPRRPRRRAARHLVEPAAREVPRHRPARRAPPGGHAGAHGGTYLEEPGTEGAPVAWWFYEDHRYSVKRLIAAAGYPADEITLAGITFDEMRPGCWQPEARLDGHGPATTSRRRCASRTTRASAARSSSTRQRQGPRRALRRGLQRLDGRRVVRRERRPAHPAVPRPAVGRRARGGRGAAQRGARRARGVRSRELPP